MKLPKPKVVISITLLLAAFFIFALAPLLVAAGVRTWIWWEGRKEHLTVEIDSVDAPMFRPVVLHHVRIRNSPSARFSIDIDIAEAQFGLNLRALFTRSDAPRIRELSIEGARASVREIVTAGHDSAEIQWPLLNRLFSERLRIAKCDLRFETAQAAIDARAISLVASELETGALTVGELTVASPLISQRFTDLRGATSWQNQRLTLGAITLARGIDIDAFTIDMSHIASRRIGLDLNVDVFGGQIRANLTSDSRDGRRLWDVAGSASDVSLVQMSETLAWRAPASGALRTCKFRFRGDPSDFTRSTASVWVEVSDFACGERAAEAIMLGASVYNRQLHLEQLYVKQPANQLTLSGDSPLTMQAEDWTRRELNADLSANITDLDAFARLCGAHAGEYTGSLTMSGMVVVEDRKLRAGMNAIGEIQVTDARLPDGTRVTADVSCNGPAATVRYAQLSRDGEEFPIWGTVTYGDLRRLEAKVFPMQQFIDVTSAPSGSCIGRFAFAPPRDNATLPVEEIEIHGGLSRSDWSISLWNGGDDKHRAVRTFSLCPASGSRDELRLAATISTP